MFPPSCAHKSQGYLDITGSWQRAVCCGKWVWEIFEVAKGDSKYGFPMVRPKNGRA